MVARSVEVSFLMLGDILRLLNGGKRGRGSGGGLLSRLGQLLMEAGDFADAARRAAIVTRDELALAAGAAR